MARTNRDWPRVRKGRNGAGQTMWVVDLRPHGKRQYFSSKDAADGEAQNSANPPAKRRDGRP